MMVWLWRLYLYWAFFWFGLAMLLLSPFLVLPYYLLPKLTAARFSWQFMRLWAAVFVFPIGGITFRRIGAQPATNAIYIANHNSYLDTPALAFCMPHPMRFLAKDSLIRFPFFGFVYKHLVIAVNRHSAKSRAQSLDQMRYWLKLGMPVLLFPEGHMNTGTQLLQPFHSGAFQLAKELNLPLVPLVIKGTRAVLPASNFALRTGKISVTVLPNLLPKQFATHEEMMQEAHTLMTSELYS
jgi:1-acyl-sn-glycerol-3-phosphate acyltransferase